MSLVMFSSVALVPISMTTAGALVQISLDGMLIGAGVGMALLSLSALLSANVRRMGLEPMAGPDDEPPPDVREVEAVPAN